MRLGWLARLCALTLVLASCVAPVDQIPATPTPMHSLPSASPSATLAVPTNEPAQTAEPTLVPSIERVLIISLDGLRPDALSPERTPTLTSLAASGAATYTAQTILPSSTLPAHSSMLSGYDVDKHGITWNDYIPANGYVRSPTIFTLAHAAGLRTAMVVGKEKLEHIAVPGSVDAFVYVPGGDFDIAAAAVDQIRLGFGVLFVHLIGPDAAGHQFGWGSSVYLGTVANSDEAVRRVLAALDEAGLRETTLLIVTADHGGHGTTHGSDRPEDRTIPWIVAGPGVRPGQILSGEVRVYDTAATAAWALGLPLPADMDGRPVTEAFGQPAS